MAGAMEEASMKTIYVIKSFLPLLFLPVAPGVLQFELARQGLLTGTWAVYVIAAQGIFTLVILAWLGARIVRQQQKAFLRMSCVSKKVFFHDQWMTVEQYLAKQHNVVVSHSMTPEESQAWLAEAEDYLRRETSEADDRETAALPEMVESNASRQLQQRAA
jgi:hypothetical protein